MDARHARPGSLDTVIEKICDNLKTFLLRFHALGEPIVIQLQVDSDDVNAPDQYGAPVGAICRGTTYSILIGRPALNA